MLTTFFLISVSGAVELLLHVIPKRYPKLRSLVAVLSGLTIAATTALLLVLSFNLFSILIAFFGLYRIFNALRLVAGRMHQNYLWHETYITSLALLGLQFAVAGLWWLWEIHTFSVSLLLVVILGLQVYVAISALISVRKHAERMRKTEAVQIAHDSDLPSVTVAIPARNETETLHDCIASLLASHYPKLEILVLDDCSQMSRTPEIIRSFAHQGVRFLQGSEPEDTWVAKNKAYEQLSRAANSEWILFCGVDIRFEPQSIRRMVAYAEQKQKNMLCIMPINTLEKGRVPLLQPIRYLRELILPRHISKRPPVLSSCWLIRNSSLQRAGGFAAVARTIVPEAYFAGQETVQNAYSFLASGPTFGITSVKNPADQRATTVRVTYPGTHRRPQTVALFTLIFIGWVAVPIVALLHALVFGQYIMLAAGAALIMIICGVTYNIALQLIYGRRLLRHIATFPLAVLAYIAAMNYSMYKYEFSEVLWKGRNVCLPVMHVVPRLPKV